MLLFDGSLIWIKQELYISLPTPSFERPSSSKTRSSLKSVYPSIRFQHGQNPQHLLTQIDRPHHSFNHSHLTNMVRFLSLITTLAAFCTTLALGQASNDNPNGKILYVNYPSCSYYKCQVTWTAGKPAYINWVNAPSGGLRIQLEPQDGTTGLQTYTLTDKVGSIHG